MNRNRIFPSQFRRRRNERGWSLSVVAGQVGTSSQHLSEIESGKVDARLSSIERIAEILGLAVMLVPKEDVATVRSQMENGKVIHLRGRSGE